MSLPPLNWLTVVVAAAPLLLVLYLMVGRRWGGAQAGPAGWLAAMLLALIFFGGNPLLLLVSAGRALLLSLFVLYIIWMAILLYLVIAQAGAIDAIGRELPKLATRQVEQALLLAWVFGSFLQGASGFGVPAAVVAPLLVGLGFTADIAVVAALMGHAWAVSFGSLGSSYLALMAATGLPGEQLASDAGLYLGICCLLCGGVVLWTTGRWQALRTSWPYLLVIGLLMAATQYGLAVINLWGLASFGAGLVGLIAMVIMLRLKRRAGSQPNVGMGELLRAFFPYVILTGVILVGRFLLRDFLSVVELNLHFPAVSTSYGWETGAGTGRSIQLFGHPGALLLYATALTYGWYRWRGTINGKPLLLKPIFAATVKRSRNSTISIITLVAMAVTMQHAGMTQLLAEAMSQSAGALFPFISPFIGALGAFMTGSNTNSNVVFGSLQQSTAEALGLAVGVILAAQTAGGAIGSVFAPAKVIVGASTVDEADSGHILKLATTYCLIILAMLGVLTVILTIK